MESWNWRNFYFDSMIEWFLSMAKTHEGSEHRFDPEFGSYITYTGMDAWNGVLIKEIPTESVDRLTSFVCSVNEYFDNKKANFDWYFFSDDQNIQ
jgi:hypothetical protein